MVGIKLSLFASDCAMFAKKQQDGVRVNGPATTALAMACLETKRRTSLSIKVSCRSNYQHSYGRKHTVLLHKNKRSFHKLFTTKAFTRIMPCNNGLGFSLPVDLVDERNDLCPMFVSPSNAFAFQTKMTGSRKTRGLVRCMSIKIDLCKLVDVSSEEPFDFDHLSSSQDQEDNNIIC